MRLAPNSRLVFLSLPFFFCPLALTVSTALAWETNLFRSAKPKAESQSVDTRLPLRTAPQGDTVSRWTNSQVVPQTPSAKEGIPAANSGRALSPVGTHGVQALAPNRSATNGRQAPQAAKNGRGALFHGYEVRLPNTLFGRDKEQAVVPPPANSQVTPAQRMAANSNARSMPTPTRGRTNYAMPADVRSQSASHTAPTTTQSEVKRAAFREPAAIPAAPEAATKETGTTAAPTRSPAEQLVTQAHEWSGSAEIEQDFSRIIETCRRARASQPGGAVAGYADNLAAWALNRRGQLKAEAGQIKEALLDFDDAIRADAKCWRALHNRGVLLAQDGHFEKAFDDFNRTIEINTEFAKAYSNRGALFVVANDLSAAMEDYARAIELDPNLPVAHRGRGRVCHLLGKLEDSNAHYDAAVQLAPDDAYAVASRADLLTDLGRYVDAAAGYDAAIKIDSKSAQAYVGSAWLLATCPEGSVRNSKLAIERAKIAIQLNGNSDAVSYDTLAAAQASAGDFAGATKSIRQAMELAAPEERDVYHDRLMMYQHAKPYRIAPVRAVSQASYSE